MIETLKMDYFRRKNSKTTVRLKLDDRWLLFPAARRSPIKLRAGQAEMANNRSVLDCFQ